jgi:hypothetical protein
MGFMSMEGTDFLIELLPNPNSGGIFSMDAILSPVNQLYYVSQSYPTPTAKANNFIVNVGTSGFDEDSDVAFCLFNKVAEYLPAPLAGNSYLSSAPGFNNGCVAKKDFVTLPSNLQWIASFISSSYNSEGFLNVTLDHSVLPDDLWLGAKRETCVPGTFCEWSSQNECVCKKPSSDPLYETCQNICSTHGGAGNLECPAEGCLGFSFKTAGLLNPNFPYGGNATLWLETNRGLFRQWNPAILDNGFIGPANPDPTICNND